MITAHTLVKNEANFIWYSVMSVIDHVDKLLIWDTGSSDETVKIIKEIKKLYPDKVDYDEFGEVDIYQYSQLRQAMLDETDGGWIFILDGDEIWYDRGISNIKDQISNMDSKYESIIVPTINLVGDMFHYQEKEAGKYKFGNRIGHYNLRFVNKNIPGLHVDGIYGKEGFVDKENKPIQDRVQEKIHFVDKPYLHATHLVRSPNDNLVMQRGKKLKYELGIPFPSDFYYPEVFFRPRPSFIPSVWGPAGSSFKFRAFFETPLRKIKRRVV